MSVATPQRESRKSKQHHSCDSCYVVSLLTTGHRPLTLVKAWLLEGPPCTPSVTWNHMFFLSLSPCPQAPAPWSVHQMSSTTLGLKISVTFPSQGPQLTEKVAFPTLEIKGFHHTRKWSPSSDLICS